MIFPKSFSIARLVDGNLLHKLWKEVWELTLVTITMMWLCADIHFTIYILTKMSRDLSFFLRMTPLSQVSCSGCTMSHLWLQQAFIILKLEKYLESYFKKKWWQQCVAWWLACGHLLCDLCWPLLGTIHGLDTTQFLLRHIFLIVLGKYWNISPTLTTLQNLMSKIARQTFPQCTALLQVRG